MIQIQGLCKMTMSDFVSAHFWLKVTFSLTRARMALPDTFAMVRSCYILADAFMRAKHIVAIPGAWSVFYQMLEEKNEFDLK